MIRLQLGKWLPRGSVPRGLLRNQDAFADNLFLQFRMLRRIGNFDSAGDHPDGCGKRALMCGPVNALGKAGHHHQPCIRQRHRKIARQLHRSSRGIARADHSHTGFRRQRGIAAIGQDRRRAFQFAQQGGIFGRIVEQIARTSLADGIYLGLDSGGCGRRIVPPAAFAEIGQSLQRGGGIAEPAQ